MKRDILVSRISRREAHTLYLYKFRDLTIGKYKYRFVCSMFRFIRRYYLTRFPEERIDLINILKKIYLNSSMLGFTIRFQNKAMIFTFVERVRIGSMTIKISYLKKLSEQIKFKVEDLTNWIQIYEKELANEYVKRFC